VHGSRSDLIEVLKDSGRSATSGHGQRLRSALVVAEVALALVLLSGAGLLVNSIARLRRVDPGFLAENTWTTEVRLPFGRYADKQRQIDFYRGALEKLAALPGVTDAGITSVLPVSGNFDRTGVIVESHPVRAGSEPDADRYAVSPGYFAAMRIPLRRGRYLTAQDREGAAPVVVVSETMARQMWPGEDALGRRLRLSWEPHEPQRKIGARTVVGIVGDVRHYGLDRPATPQLYLPHAQYPLGGMSVVVRGTTSASAIRETLGALDRDIPRETVERIEDVIAGSMILRRYSLYLLGGFAGVAALLAAVGVYGVMSYTVSQRTPEIGVRMALGAASRDVLAMVLGRSAALIGAGMALGLALAAVLTRYLGALLFEVHPMDAPTLLAAVAALAIAALLAAIVPAQRAARVEPMVALRHE
jgi:putative ABC transport system permease protein